jgi:hypothetical protein
MIGHKTSIVAQARAFLNATDRDARKLRHLGDMPIRDLTDADLYTRDRLQRAIDLSGDRALVLLRALVDFIETEVVL